MSTILNIINRPTVIDGTELLYGAKNGADALISASVLVSIANGGSSTLPLSGGTMSGSLVLAADPTTSLQAATKHYVDNATPAIGSATIVATGATQGRLLADRAADVFNARDFGGTWDGVTDLSAIIQAAINEAVAAGNGIVQLPATIIPIATQVVPTGGFTLRGHGPGTIIRATGGNTSTQFLFGLASISNVTFENLVFDGGASGGSTGPASVFSATIAGTAMSVTTLPTNGVPIAAGQFLFSSTAGLNASVRITSGSGSSWTLSSSQTVASPIQITGVIPGMEGSISGSTVSLFGSVSGAPLAVGQTLSWQGGSDIITGGSGLAWTLASSHGTVVFQPMFAGPSALSPMVTLFRTNNVKFNRVVFQNSIGLGLNSSPSNDTTVSSCKFTNLGNRWKATLAHNDRIQGCNFGAGDLTLWGLNNKVVDSSFFDIGLDAISASKQVKMVWANNTFELENYQRVQITPASGDFASAINPNNGVGNTIIGNTVTGAQGNSIDAPGLRDSTIGNNSLRNNGGCGIGLFQGTDFTTFTGAISSGNTLTVSVAPTAPINAGFAIGSTTGTPIVDGTYILEQLPGGTPGGVGTYLLNNSQTVTSQALLAGTNVRNVTVVGNSIKDACQWSSNEWGAGIVIGNGVADTIVISANTVIDDQIAPTQPYGIGIISAVGTVGTWAARPINLSIGHNRLNGNVTGPIFDASTGLSKTIAHNGGIDDAVGTIASAGTLALPFNPKISVTGSTGVTALTGPLWTGREVTFLPTGAVVFTAGGNIGNTVTTVANVPLLGFFDGSKMWLK